VSLVPVNVRVPPEAHAHLCRWRDADPTLTMSAVIRRLIAEEAERERLQRDLERVGRRRNRAG
jgi:hypothetical protein